MNKCNTENDEKNEKIIIELKNKLTTVMFKNYQQEKTIKELR